VAFKGIPNPNHNQDSEAEEITLWEVTQEDTRNAMKTHFLAGLSQEQNKSVRNKVCDTIAEMARASTASERMLQRLRVFDRKRRVFGSILSTRTHAHMPTNPPERFMSP